MDIVFVTSNKGKVDTAKKYLDKVNLECYNYDIDEPNINDIKVIAEYKVKEAYKKVNKPCISLDSGFYILGYPNNPNFPGAFPKRELLNKMGINGLLEIMKDIDNRKCYFLECLAYYDGANIKYFYGKSEGSLSYEVRGNDKENKWSDLWYIFIPNNHDKTLAEMDDFERNNRKDLHTSAFEEFNKWCQSL